MEQLTLMRVDSESCKGAFGGVIGSMTDDIWHELTTDCG
jgi:hypothetical protein